MILIVGCGDNPHPKALVCADLYLKPCLHRECGTTIEPRKFRNFVRFDCYRLPLGTEVLMLHMQVMFWSMLKTLLKALKEWGRVAPKVIVRALDLRGQVVRESNAHIHTWTAYSLENLLKKAFKKVQVREKHYPLLWERLGLTPSLFNYMTRRILCRFFVFETLELIGIGEEPDDGGMT